MRKWLTTATVVAVAVAADARPYVTKLLAERQAVLTTAHTTVHGKVAAAQAAHAVNARLAYRIVRLKNTDRRGARIDGTEPGLVESARLNAYVEWRLARSAAELRLLATEQQELDAAIARHASLASTGSHAAGEPVLPPVIGEVVRGVGNYQEQGITLHSTGTWFATTPSAPVTAVAAGVVRYTGPARGLGATIIVDHGDTVSVLAPVTPSADVVPGHEVKAGAVVGKAVKTRIFFELRLDVGGGGIAVAPQFSLPPNLAR